MSLMVLIRKPQVIILFSSNGIFKKRNELLPVFGQFSRDSLVVKRLLNVVTGKME